MADKEKHSGKQLTTDIIIIVLLILGLAITSGALGLATISVNNNLFWSGAVKINLNDGKPVIAEQEFLFEPGMTVKKDFFIENQSTWDVYYRLYFVDIRGDLAEFVQITIKDGERVLYNCLAKDLIKENIPAANDLLKLNERRDLTICFHLPPETENQAMGKALSFTFCAEAVQTKNNPFKLFD